MDKKIIIFIGIILFFSILCLQYKFILTIKNKKIISRFSTENTIFKDYEKLLRDTSFNKPCDINNIKLKNKNNRTIFISIASYRDDECPNTLNSIYNNAKYPDRIYTGVCQQNHSTDIDCFTSYLNTRADLTSNIRIIRLEDFEAKGPTYARYLCSKLYNNEDYYLQIDSHIHFVKDWDTKIIDMIDSIQYDKAVITNHPKDWTTESTATDENLSTFCKGNFNGSSMIAYTAGLVSNKGPCMLIPYCAAGFFFTYGCFLNEVPFDPNLNQLFEGEEGLFSIRLWTSGWNMYAPNKDICFHYYTRSDKPKYWSNPDYSKYVGLSQHKTRVLMGIDEMTSEDNFNNDFKLYGLGSVRTLSEYYKFIGFNKNDKTFSVNFCS